MKFRYFFGAFLALILLFGNNAKAQIVDCDVFMQGQFLEVCVAPNGAWGNTAAPPTGYHPHTGGSTYYTDPCSGTSYSGGDVDFAYNVSHAGWSVAGTGGEPQYGPYFLPGTPFDGWAVQVNGEMCQAFYTTTGFASSMSGGMGGSVTGYLTALPASDDCLAPSSKIGVWDGYQVTTSGDSLKIHSENRVDTTASWDVVTIKFTNASATTMTGLYYFATADPDNDEPYPGGSFPTDNHIQYQNDARHRVMVDARPPSIHQDAYSSLCTRDCRAQAMIYQSWPPSYSSSNNLDLVAAGTATGMSTCYYTLDAWTISQDIAFGLIYNLGDLAPGDSTIISFAWNFEDTASVDSAFPDPVLVVNGTQVGQPDTAFGCSFTTPTIPVCIGHGHEKNWSWASWTWSPAIGLAATTGVTNSINYNALSGPTTYTITGNDSTTGMHSCNNYVLHLTVTPCFAAVNNGPLCYGDTLRLDATGDSVGASYLWYNSAGTLAGTVHHLVIYPALYSDSGTWMLVRTVSGIHDTARTHVVIRWKPTLTLTTNTPLCAGMVDTLRLTSGPDSVGERFSWTGPSLFTSTLENPNRTGFVASDTGVYTVIATTSFGCKDTASIDATLLVQPPTPVLTGVTHYCSGDPFVPFTVTGYTGTLHWSTTATGAGTTTTPVINTSFGATYRYWVWQVEGACVSLRDSITVTVVVTPSPPFIGGSQTYCQYDTYVPPTATGTNILWYTTATGGTGTTTPASVNTSVAGVTTLYATQSDSGCTSPRAAFPITVNPMPLPPVITGVTVYCQGDVPIPFTVTGVTGSLLWYTTPTGGVGSTTATAINTTTPGVTTYYVAQTNGFCISGRVSITVHVHPTPVTPVITGTSSYCEYQTYIPVSAATSGTGIINWYTIIGGAPSFTPPVINTAIPGTYTIYATQSDSGCVSPIDSFRITVHPMPDAPIVAGSTIYCQDDAPVAFTLAGITGTPLWYTAATGGVGSTTPTPINTATPGVITYWVSQTNGFCESPRSSITVLVHPRPTKPVISGIANYCQYDAFIPLTAPSTGTGVIHWYTSVGGGSSPTCPIINTAIPGTYTIYATQTDSGCLSFMDSFTVTISTMPDMPVITGPTVYCLNDPFVPFTVSDVTATVHWYTTATGGAGSTTAGTVNTAVVGVTRFWVSQANGACVSPRDSITVHVHPIPAMPVITGPTTYCQYDTYVYPMANSSGTGVIQWFTILGGTPSLSAPVVSTLVPGVTTIYASQVDSGCISPLDSIKITVNPKPNQPEITDTPNQYCPGQPFVPFTIISGTNLLWYLTESGGVGSPTTPTINTSIPGTYTFYVTQTEGSCVSDRIAVTVTVFNNVVANFTDVIKLGCNGDSVICTNLSTNASNYEWSFGDGYLSNETNPLHIYHTQGTFKVTLYSHSDTACIDSMSKNITLLHPLSASFSVLPSDTVCQNTPLTFSSTVAATLPVYLWNFDDSTKSNLADPTHTYPTVGVYTVSLTVTDLIPCSVTVSKIVTVDTQTGVKLVVTDSVLCQGTFATFTGLFSGIGNVSLSWNFGDGNGPLIGRNPVSYSYNYPDSFTVTLNATFRACPEASATRKIWIMPQPQVNLGPDTVICPGGNPILLRDITNISNPDASWLWNTGQTTSSIYVGSPGIYTATVNIKGCYTTDSIVVGKDCYMDIPNIFTPNGDGVNDYFYPRQYLTKGLATFHLSIFNRWGELIFESSSLDGRGWDGKFNGVDQPEGVYIFLIDAVFIDGVKEHHTGNITLLR